MDKNKVLDRILQTIPDAEVKIDGSDCNLSVDVTSSMFAGKTKLEQHRLVNNIFTADFQTGSLHALEIKTSVK